MISVVAHRGDSESARENTPEAIRSALDAGADVVQLDVRTTRDAVSVVLNDPTLLRLWGLPRPVGELELDELAALGHGECRIPSLAEALALVSELNQQRTRPATVLLDVPTARDARLAAQVVRSCTAAPRIHWRADTEALIAVLEVLPDARTIHRHPGGELDLATLSRLGSVTVDVEWTRLDARLVDQVHRLGLDVACGCVDDAETMSWLIDLGMDAITTSRPRLLRRLLRGGTSPLALLWDGTDAAAVRTGLPPELLRWAQVARELAVWANGHTRTAALGQVSSKAHQADLVTEVDLAVEQHVRRTIAERLGDEHVVVGEELGGHPQAGRPTWWLDPVDGTTNLANSLPWTSMSLALALHDVPVVAAIAQPALDHVFLAAEGLGATLDGEPLELARATTLAGRTVLTELDAHQPWPGMDRFLTGLAERHATVRIMGSGTLALAGVAAGWAAGAVVHSFNPIDHLAGVLVAREAGAEVLQPGGPVPAMPRPGEPLVMACPGVAEQLLALLR